MRCKKKMRLKILNNKYRSYRRSRNNNIELEKVSLKIEECIARL